MNQLIDVLAKPARPYSSISAPAIRRPTRAEAEQAVRTKVLADPEAAALGKQIVAGLARRKHALQEGFGRN